MTPVITNPVELRQRGFEALVASLGWVNAVRFLHQYEVNDSDYTREREQILPNWDSPTLVRLARDRAQQS
jgi:hypothetical protein